MPHFWNHFGGRSTPKQRNLQDGLFQIASQTCSLLVQVNNTNNISYGHNNSNIHLNTLSSSSIPSTSTPLHTTHIPKSRTTVPGTKTEADREQLIVLIPPNPHEKSHHHHFHSGSSSSTSRYKSGVLGKPRLSPVPETPASSPPPHDEENDAWGGQAYALAENDDHSKGWGRKNKWCRPSCIPISIICILIFLVVLLPLLDHAAEKALQELNAAIRPCDKCRLSLVESIPEGLIYNNSNLTYPSTFDTWMELINSAEKSIEIASLYWTLRQSEVYPDPSSIKGEKIFQALLNAGTKRGIEVRIAQNAPSQQYPNIDTEFLMKRKAATVRSVNFARLLGGGVLHTKMWIIDRKHFYIGSANMDWRSLTQVKEMGIVVYNCSCLAEDAAKIFDVYWYLGEENAKIPTHWPMALSTKINLKSPLNLVYDNETFQTYISSAPLPLNPTGRTNDINALLNVIKHAEKFIYIAVMDYFPLMIYSPKRIFWPVIDDALKTAAVENQIKIRLLISKWNHSRPAEDNFLKSLASVDSAYPGVSIQVRRFIVPSNDSQHKIPFARVNHNKYMVTDNTAYIGTSNWSGDYFTNSTAGVSFILHQDPAVFERNIHHETIRRELQGVFERDWNSKYAHSID